MVLEGLQRWQPHPVSSRLCRAVLHVWLAERRRWSRCWISPSYKTHACLSMMVALISTSVYGCCLLESVYLLTRT